MSSFSLAIGSGGGSWVVCPVPQLGWHNPGTVEILIFSHSSWPTSCCRPPWGSGLFWEIEVQWWWRGGRSCEGWQAKVVRLRIPSCSSAPVEPDFGGCKCIVLTGTAVCWSPCQLCFLATSKPTGQTMFPFACERTIATGDTCSGVDPGFASGHGRPSPGDCNHSSSVFPSVLCRPLVLHIDYGCHAPEGFCGRASLGNHLDQLPPLLQSCSQPGLDLLKQVGILWGDRTSSKQGMLDFLN